MGCPRASPSSSRENLLVPLMYRPPGGELNLCLQRLAPPHGAQPPFYECVWHCCSTAASLASQGRCRGSFSLCGHGGLVQSAHYAGRVHSVGAREHQHLPLTCVGPDRSIGLPRSIRLGISLRSGSV